MRVQCPKCKKVYDDTPNWTICPHNPLDVAWSAVYCKYHDLFNCYLCDHSGMFDYREILGEYVDPQAARIHELERWKEEQMEVESLWDPQAIGELLQIAAGHGLRLNLKTKIEELLQRCKDLQNARNYQEQCAIEARQTIAAIQALLLKYNE